MTKDSCGDTGINALIVDDNESNLFVLKGLLESYGVYPDKASSGFEAVEKACAVNYDFILMDYLMPDMDGVEATRKIVFVSNPEKIPKIIGVSASVNPEVERLFKNAGADRVINKPVTTEELEECVGHFLNMERKQEIEANREQYNADDASVFLSGVHGLEYEKGMQGISSGLSDYMKILKVCISNIEDNIQPLIAMGEQGDWKNSTIYFHSLKGIFLNIAVPNLTESSKKMEFASKEFKWDYIESEIDNYIRSILTFNEELKVACDRYQKSREAEIKVKASFSDEEWQKNMQKLYGHIEEYEYMEIVDLLEEMMKSEDKERVEKLQEIYDDIQDFEYEKALELIKKIME